MKVHLFSHTKGLWTNLFLWETLCVCVCYLAIDWELNRPQKFTENKTSYWGLPQMEITWNEEKGIIHIFRKIFKNIKNIKIFGPTLYCI